MVNILHVSSPQILAKHQENIMASLAHRLEVARAMHNSHLIELLEQEQKQIAIDLDRSLDSPKPHHWLKPLKQLVQALFSRKELQVSEFVNGSDRWWYAFDPETGNCVYADSEAELRLWIEQNYQGQ